MCGREPKKSKGTHEEHQSLTEVLLECEGVDGFSALTKVLYQRCQKEQAESDKSSHLDSRVTIIPL